MGVDELQILNTDNSFNKLCYLGNREIWVAGRAQIQGDLSKQTFFPKTGTITAYLYAHGNDEVKGENWWCRVKGEQLVE